MKVLVLGRGFLGQKFEQRGYEVWGRDRFDLPSNGLIHPRMHTELANYGTIINCIGKSDTRWCEGNYKEARWSNAGVPRQLSRYCADEGIKFIHISTGCLYGDALTPQNENSHLSAHCKYTLTKWAGETEVNEWDLVLRPRLLFSDFKVEGRNNLLCKLPKFTRFLISQNSYTSLDIIVDAVEALEGQSGVFNVACAGHASPMEIARWIGLKGSTIMAEELWEQEGLHLVNNIMDISKLQKFYQPPKLKDEIMRCWEALS